MARVKFIDKNWNFNSKPFLDIYNAAQKWFSKWKKNSSDIDKRPKNVIIIWWISPKEIWELINKLGNFLNSWIDIKTAFWILSKQVSNPKLKQITEEIRINLNHGLSISDTLKQHKKYFEDLIIALIEVWEKTWNLPRVLVELDKKLLENIELRSRIKWALTYPVILILITISMVVFMMTFVLPKITDSFRKTWVALPALTQFMIDISDFIRYHYWISLIWIWLFTLFYAFFKRTYVWKLVLWKIALKLPVFWHIIMQSNIILFINSFTLLLWAWVLMLEALETSAWVVWNIWYKKEIIRMKNEVETWIKLSNAMWLMVNNKEMIFSNKYFPEDLVHMINIWEETGTIWKSIEKIWVNYTKELKSFIWNLMTMLEPFIIVFVWALVWTIVIAIMLPFFNLAKVAKKI